MTQGELVIKYMEDFGSISPMEAFHDLGITKLATRISELKKDGWKFHTVVEKSVNRYGKKTHYCRYSLVKEGSVDLSQREGCLQKQ